MATIAEIKAAAGECDVRKGVPGAFYPQAPLQLRCRENIFWEFDGAPKPTLMIKEGEVLTVKIIDENNTHPGNIHFQEIPFCFNARDFDIVE